MRGWKQDLKTSVWERWAYIDDRGLIVLYLFHNFDDGYLDSWGHPRWSWMATGIRREHPIPDTARTLEERQAYALAEWRMS